MPLRHQSTTRRDRVQRDRRGRWASPLRLRGVAPRRGLAAQRRGRRPCNAASAQVAPNAHSRGRSSVAPVVADVIAVTVRLCRAYRSVSRRSELRCRAVTGPVPRGPAVPRPRPGGSVCRTLRRRALCGARRPDQRLGVPAEELLYHERRQPRIQAHGSERPTLPASPDEHLGHPYLHGPNAAAGSAGGPPAMALQPLGVLKRSADSPHPVPIWRSYRDTAARSATARYG